MMIRNQIPKLIFRLCLWVVIPSQVSELRARFPGKDIQVDGGLSEKTVKPCADAGSNVIVAGTAIFNAENPSDVIFKLRKAVDDGKESWPKAA